jgi:uncharacterized protein HemY
MLIILLFTSTTNAILLSYKQRIYQRLQEYSTFQKIIDKISKIASYNKEIVNDVDNNTINTTGEGTILNDEPTTDENQENKITHEGLIEIFTQNNEKFETILKRIYI